MSPPTVALDLGSGGGLPGLVLAAHWPTSRWTLLDASERRTNFLEQVVIELDLQRCVTVVRARAEEAARQPSLRGSFDLVVARSFGPPAVTAECAAAFLHVNGLLAVSEPPDDRADRWPASELRGLGLEDRGRHGAVRVLEQVELASDAVPRRVGIPAKRPRW